MHWGGSEAAGLAWAPAGPDGDDLVLRLSVAAGRDAASGIEGHLGPVEVVLRGARCRAGDPALCLGTIAHGEMTGPGMPAPARGLPVPGGREGPLVLELRLASGAEMRIEARALRAAALPGARLRESYAC